MSKLSYLGERSESRENARASGEAARGRGKYVLARLASLAKIGGLARGVLLLHTVFRSGFLHILVSLAAITKTAAKETIYTLAVK